MFKSTRDLERLTIERVTSFQQVWIMLFASPLIYEVIIKNCCVDIRNCTCPCRDRTERCTLEHVLVHKKSECFFWTKSLSERWLLIRSMLSVLIAEGYQQTDDWQLHRFQKYFRFDSTKSSSMNILHISISLSSNVAEQGSIDRRLERNSLEKNAIVLFMLMRLSSWASL